MWLFLAIVLVAGCGPGATSPPADPGQSASSPAPGNRTLRLGAVLPMFSHPFFIAQRQGLEEEAKRLGVEIEVRDGQDDDQKQIVQVEALITRTPDLIILCPRDEAALVPAVESANRAKIPVVTLNRRVEGGDVVTYVGADDVEGGRIQARALVERLGEKGGAVLYFQGTPGSSPQVSRARGFKEVLQGHPEITLAAEVFANFQEDQAKEQMTGLVRRFPPGQVQAIVAQADEMALPAAEVAQDQGWKIPVYGFNGTRDAFEAITAGRLEATVLQNAAEQGRLAVQAAVDHLRGKSLPAEIHTPLPLVTRDNASTLEPAY
jgi:ribose transport system substrate-binding protein